MTSQRLKVCVVGLGKIGSQFDSDPKRKTVWSHVGAYLSRLDHFELCACVEPNAAAVAAFRERCPIVPVYPDISAMPDSLSLDVVSICTPMATHLEMIQSIFNRHSPKVIWCEKPLEADLARAKEILALSRKNNATIVVSHVRRWLPLWRKVRRMLMDGAVGTVTCVRVALPNRILSIGSHAIDLLAYLGGDIVSVSALPVPSLAEDGEAAIPALLRFKSGAYGIYQVTGMKSELVVEAEIIGTEGRLTVDEHDGAIRVEKFVESDQFDSYRRLQMDTSVKVASFDSVSPFVEIVDEIVRLIAGIDAKPTCSGADAFLVQKTIDRMLNAPQSPTQARGELSGE